MDSRRLLLLLLLSLVLSGAAGALAPPSAGAKERLSTRAESAAKSTVIYPPQDVPLRFDHRRHLERAKLTCVYCHTLAATSRKSSDRLLPDPSRCDACHGTNHEDLGRVAPGIGVAKECSFCHEGHRTENGNLVARVRIPEPNLKFEHVAHYGRGVRCIECHGSVATAALATRADLPTMRSCFRCHAGADERSTDARTASGNCGVCHITGSSGRLVTAFSTGALLPPRWLHNAEHGPDWVERHKVVAGADSAFCATCHFEQECVDCHDGRVRPRRVHPNDWISMHPVAARQGDPNCSSCHRAQSFCITCHERTGVSASGPLGDVQNQGRFHPPASIWTDPPRRAGHHSWEAERNMMACVSCHTERDCAQCHATAARGGRGGLNPHPVGFDSSCRGAMGRNARPCLFCHDTADPALSRCR